MAKISSNFLSVLSNSEKMQLCADLFTAKNWGLVEIERELPSGRIVSIPVSRLKKVQDSVETMFG
jgi:hypothetical protein